MNAKTTRAIMKQNANRLYLTAVFEGMGLDVTVDIGNNIIIGDYLVVVKLQGYAVYKKHDLVVKHFRSSPQVISFMRRHLGLIK